MSSAIVGSLAVIPTASAITVTQLSPDSGISGECRISYTDADIAALEETRRLLDWHPDEATGPGGKKIFDNRPQTIDRALAGLGSVVWQRMALELNEDLIGYFFEGPDEVAEYQKTKAKFLAARNTLAHPDDHTRDELVEAATTYYTHRGYSQTLLRAWEACSEGENFDKDIPSINELIREIPGSRPFVVPQEDPGTTVGIVLGVLGGIAALALLAIPVLVNIVPGLATMFPPLAAIPSFSS
ncbi:hypothetical protein CPHO_06765 [Corynebacterium phocae]|uniref:Uncharacterized protein n=2 Tax=Corynebacterium phocae TaxID=161895 RepID=A0A1L7D3J3_9CORY|nr:hypothetical protein [Corynebacterium phocae]APT92643.1 hypothetical protein CPHO_06765 [Corynebacterium phocae]